MRKVCILIAAFLTTWAYACAGEKVVDDSGKRPKWLYAAEKEYIIVSAESANLEEAKDKTMLQVKKHILASIAENVKSTANLNTREQGVNGKYTILENYESAIETQSALIPFLSEVSITKAEDYYWEKIKNGKEFTYRYHLKYPFSKFDLMRMSDEFLEHERELDEKLAAFAADDFTSYKSTEEMVQQLQQLRLFKASLMDGDSRHSTCLRIEKVYNDYLKSIQLRLISANKEQLVFTLYFGDNRISTRVQPKLTSNCLGNIQFLPRGEECVVTYDYHTACYEDEENYLDVALILVGNKIKNRFIVK